MAILQKIVQEQKISQKIILNIKDLKKDSEIFIEIVTNFKNNAPNLKQINKENINLILKEAEKITNNIIKTKELQTNYILEIIQELYNLLKNANGNRNLNFYAELKKELKDKLQLIKEQEEKIVIDDEKLKKNTHKKFLKNACINSNLFNEIEKNETQKLKIEQILEEVEEKILETGNMDALKKILMAIEIIIEDSQIELNNLTSEESRILYETIKLEELFFIYMGRFTENTKFFEDKIYQIKKIRSKIDISLNEDIKTHQSLAAITAHIIEIANNGLNYKFPFKYGYHTTPTFVLQYAKIHQGVFGDPNNKGEICVTIENKFVPYPLEKEHYSKIREELRELGIEPVEKLVKLEFDLSKVGQIRRPVAVEDQMNEVNEKWYAFQPPVILENVLTDECKKELKEYLF
ncbi:hypothetical protein K9L67_03265 [Candidatus Woesearchaeota archaeon]|nr:hypothetical protein [Candidatus Woesearchaeota archaeon]MCF7901221.1 hypothetical protein [Candidatus Woesearchaeota archaeon]MCF8013750.1 hypothetical protein [Candidatus Woesearchaeota archaeon]